MSVWVEVVTVLCFLWNNMDLIVYDTLIKLTCDYCLSNTGQITKLTLFQGNVVAFLDVPFRRSKGQLNTKNNVEDIVFVLYKNRTGLHPLDTNNVDSANLQGKISSKTGDGELAPDSRDAKREMKPT